MIWTLLSLALLYALPNFYPSLATIELRPAVGTATTQETIAEQADEALRTATIPYLDMRVNGPQTIFSFAEIKDQLAARKVTQQALTDQAVIALGTTSAAPAWLAAIGARPVALGLDLRGGAQFLLQVDTDFVLMRFWTAASANITASLREKQIRHADLIISGRELSLLLAEPAQASAAVAEMQQAEPRLTYENLGDGKVRASLSNFQFTGLLGLAVGQNTETLRRRIDEIGVAEPVIARQGDERILVQLPGLQDTARAKAILGRRAALELRGVNERLSASANAIARAERGAAPAGTELFRTSDNRALLLETAAVITGENIIDASYGSDEAGRPAVHLALDGPGAARMKAYTRKHLSEQLAIVLIERDHSEVLSAPRIESELHARFLIHGGGMQFEDATELALLLRSGSLAAPMEIVEERTVGPSLGADNIRRGLRSVAGGFTLVALMIICYYLAFGSISVCALLANLLCLTALLASLGAALTLPGLAAFALTVGMAIDANVLINERIREEWAAGRSPGLAIEAGYKRALATILDANLTTLIAGLALFALGSGPVRGFAVVLCLGIATSMFTALMLTRALVDLLYGRRGRLKTISIG